MSLRRGGAKLRALSKAHSPLHILLWQTRETERTLLASAAVQKTLFADLATWASTENRALSDVCSNFSELITLATAAQAQLAQAYKSFRKDMNMILEGEKRADVAQRKLQEAEGKRHKVRRLVLQAQNRTQITAENLQASSDYASLQTQLAESERRAERAHMTACETKSESEAVKLVVVRSTLSKLSQSNLAYAYQVQTIYQGGQQLVLEIPDPPPPGDLLSCIRYTGFESTRNTLSYVKSQVQIISTSPNRIGPAFASTPLTSPIATTSSSSSPLGNWTSVSPSAPENPFLTSETDMPPPYNTSFHSVQNGSWSSGHRRNNSSRGRRSTSTAPSNSNANPNTSSTTMAQIQPNHNNGIPVALTPPSVSYHHCGDIENPNHSRERY